jgi:CBS domain containing-hemolysin-like protein
MGSIDGDLVFNLVVLLVSLVFCALFSFLETGMVALRLFQLKELAEKTGKYQKLFSVLEHDPNKLLNAILLAYNFANTIATVWGTRVIAGLLFSWPSYISEPVNVIVVTAVLLIIGDIVPKNVVKYSGETFFRSTLWLTNLTFYSMYAFVAILGKFTDALVRLIVGSQVTQEEPITSERELQFLIGYIDEKGLMEPEKTNMLQSIFRLSNTTVRDIMVPLPDVVMVESTKPLQVAYQLFTKYQYSRIPVYRDDPNNAIGMLHFKDIVPLVASNTDKPICDLMRPLIFVPESIKVNQMLKELKSQQMHMAMVINEHGGITGIVTLEDVLEEIVGEIHDEYESITEKIVPMQPSGWMANGSMELDKLAMILKIKFEAVSSSTLGGFLIEQLQHMPKKGEHLLYKDYLFQVQQVTSKKIVQVLIREKENAGQIIPVP